MDKQEHYLHHANITRTEQLPFYTFSEIAKDEKNFKMGKTYTLIEDKNFVLDINKSYVSQIVLYTGKEKYSWNFNEANFYKAYDECIRLFKGGLSDFDCPLKSLHEYKKELVAKVLGMVRENLKEELLLTKNENQEEAKLKLVKTYSIDLDVLNKIEKDILNGYTKI